MWLSLIVIYSTFILTVKSCFLGKSQAASTEIVNLIPLIIFMKGIYFIYRFNSLSCFILVSLSDSLFFLIASQHFFFFGLKLSASRLDDSIICLWILLSSALMIQVKEKLTFNNELQCIFFQMQNILVNNTSVCTQIYCDYVIV